MIATEPTSEHDTVPNYAPRALRRWAEGDPSHSPSRCRCIVCADGRAALGQPPLAIRVGHCVIPALPCEDHITATTGRD